MFTFDQESLTIRSRQKKTPIFNKKGILNNFCLNLTEDDYILLRNVPTQNSLWESNGVLFNILKNQFGLPRFWKEKKGVMGPVSSATASGTNIE